MNNIQPIFTRRDILFLCATLCTLFWGSSYAAIKSGYAILEIARDNIPAQMLFAGYRFLLAGVFLLLFAKITGKSLAVSSLSHWRQISILGLTQTTVQYVFFYIGVMAVNFNKSALDFDVSLEGEGFIVIAAFTLAAASIYGKRISQHMDVLIMTAWQLSIGGMALMVLGWSIGGSLGNFDLQSSLLLIYLALLSPASICTLGDLAQI